MQQANRAERRTGEQSKSGDREERQEGAEQARVGHSDCGRNSNEADQGTLPDDRS